MSVKAIRATLCVGVAIFVLAACEQGPGTPTSTESYASRIFTLQSSQFRISGTETFRGSAAGQAFPMTEITQNVIDKGMVQAHFEIPDVRGAWGAMPFTLTVEAGGRSITVTLSYAVSVGEVGVTLASNLTASEMASVVSLFNGYRIRVVVGQP